MSRKEDMTTDSRERGAAFWTTVAFLVVVVGLVIYPLSIGPAYSFALRIRSRPGPDWEWPGKAIGILYTPVVRLAVVTNSVESLTAYVNWWTRR